MAAASVASAGAPRPAPPPPPEQAERERHDGRVSPIPTLQPVSDFLESLRAAGAHAKPYQILGPLGKGKFAMVYKAALGSELFALKKVAIFEMMNQSSREKCLKEIQLLQSLSHQNIIRYEDSYLDLQTNELVIVLQWARGGDLKKLIRKVKTGQAKITEFSEGMIWKYAMELANGLEYMHEKRVMHRDLKPANIMLTHDNHVLIGDLGLSRYFNPQTLEAFSKVGTPLYLSPEVLMGTGYGFGADTWSLGCILYELCTLVSPFKPTTEGVNLYALFANIRAGKYEPIPALTPSGAAYSENLRSLITAMIRIDPLTRPSMQQVAAVARKMVEQRLGKQMQLKENQAQAMQLHEEERRKAEATAAAAAAGGDATSAVQPVASASPASPPSLSASPPASTAAPASSTTVVSPSSHLAVQFADGSPIPLTPTVSSLPVSRPLNASPLPSPDAVLAVAAELATLHNVPRAMSPISPILQRKESIEQANGKVAAASAVANASPASVSSASPPVIVNRPPSATRPTSASRPISATHRPNPGAQRPVAPVSAVGASNIAAAAPAPKIASPPADRPSSKEGGLRPSSKESARPTSQSSARPSSGTRPASGSKPPSRSLLQQQQQQQQQDGGRAGTAVDHFPSSASAAGVRPLSLPSHARTETPSILSALSDSREEADESSMENGAHSPARIGRPTSGVNLVGQSFLYDRASPSPSPKSAESGKASFHLADPAHALAPVPEQHHGDDYRGAHMSFAEAPTALAEATSPPPAGMESFRPPSATVAAARPLSRGAIHSAGTRQQPVIARPLSGTVTSPPATTSFGTTQQLASSPPFLEEDLSPDPKGPVSSPAPPAQRSRSINPNSPTAAGKSPALTSPVSRSGGDSSRVHRVKSASATEGSSAVMNSPSRRLPLSHFTSPDSQDSAANGDDDDDLFLRPHANSALAATPALPPRPVSVDAPQRPVPTPSALLVQSAALPFPSCEGMMEDTLEALKMLHYESRFCGRWKLPWITHEYFVHDFAAIWAKQNGRGRKAAASTRPGVSPTAAAEEVKFAVSVSAVPPNPPPTQSQQLLYFGYLCLWLLSFLLRPSGGKDAVDNEQLSSLLGELNSWREYSDYRDSDEGEPADRRSSLAATILSHLALVKLPLPSPGLSVESLSTSASGEKLLQLLFRLTQAVYYKKLHGSVVLSPLALRHYPRFEPNPELAAREEEEEAEEELEEEGAVEEDMMDEAALTDEQDDPNYAPTSAQDQSFVSAPQTDSERDAAARQWTEEYTRLSESSALALNLSKISASGVREWQMHREAVVKHAASLKASPLVAASPTSAAGAASPSAKPSSLTPSTLPLRSQELRRMLDKISAFEARLARDQGFKSLAEEYATVRSRLESTQEVYSSLTGSNGSEHARLVSLDESLAHTLEAAKTLRDSTDGAGGGGGLREIAKAMSRLRREISQMNVAIGIKAAMIQTHRAAEQKQRAMRKQRG